METEDEYRQWAALRQPVPKERLGAESIDHTLSSHEPWVAETRFGTWFINTGVWVKYVLQRSLDDLKRIAADRLPSSPRVLDLGCGRGKATPLLLATLGARSVVGVDVDSTEVARAEKDHGSAYASFEVGSAATLPLRDASVDVVFCHQCLHHFIDQETALAEIHRVLRPGGVLLLSESCRAFIFTRRIRYLFRHPMEVQKTAEEYLELLERSGFALSRDSHEISFVWWSRRDMGLFERLGFNPRRPQDTLLNVAAIRA